MMACASAVEMSCSGSAGAWAKLGRPRANIANSAKIATTRDDDGRMTCMLTSLARSCREEFDEMIVDLIGRLLLHVVAGRERLRVHEVAGEFSPHRGIFLARRRPARSKQEQERHPDLAVFVGRIHLEVACGGCAIVAAGARDRLLREAADIFVEYDLGGCCRPLRRLFRYHSAGTALSSVSGNGSGCARNVQCQEFMAHLLSA